MDKITKKKDFKLLIAFFSLEAVILLICFFIAHAKVNRALDVSIGSGKYGNFIDSIRCVRSNILEKSFDGGGLEGFAAIRSYDTDGGGNAEANDILYKYYTFNLSDTGITSNLTKAAPGTQMSGIVSNTATSTVIEEAKSTFTLGNFKIANDYVTERLDLVNILENPLVIEPMDASEILIYHVHATEGYCATAAEQSDLDHYTSEGEENNVVAAGNILQNAIVSGSGISVLHDKTVFKEGLQSIIAYDNAAQRLNEIYSEHENVKLQIDLHRNSATLDGKKYGPTVQKDGVNYAQFSFVIGLDWDPVTGNRSDSVNPYWEDNFKLCMLIMEKLEEKVPGIVRQIDLRRNPYNQGFVENSILVEIGFDGNLTSEAEASAQLFGEVLCDIYG